MEPRPQDEHSLGDTREYLGKILDCVADPIFVKDREHRWVLLNDMFCAFMGRTKEELAGKSDYDFFPKKEADVFWQKDEEVFVTGRENVNEEFFTDGHGVKRVIITKKTRYTNARGDHFIVGVIRDISELKKASEDLKVAYEKVLNLQNRMIQSEKMASLGLLAGGVAHEINNPVAYILSNLYTLQEYHVTIEDLIKNLPSGALAQWQESQGDKGKIFEALEDTPTLIQETVQGAERIRKIVADLRAFAHPAEGKMMRADLCACIDRTLDMLANELRQKVKVVRDYGQIPLVLFHEHQMLEVFLNLFINAIHAIEGHGVLTVKVAMDGDHVRIDIHDTGVGISRIDLPRIFDPFFTTKPVGQGTGLGLSVVHGIIMQHHGEIGAVSEPGEGTTFSVRLPCVPTEK